MLGAKNIDEYTPEIRPIAIGKIKSNIEVMLNAKVTIITIARAISVVTVVLIARCIL